MCFPEFKYFGLTVLCVVCFQVESTAQSLGGSFLFAKPKTTATLVQVVGQSYTHIFSSERGANVLHQGQLLPNLATTQPKKSTDFTVTVFPNPATDFVTILLSTNASIKDITLFDIQGKIIALPFNLVTPSHGQLITQSLPPSVYFIKITNNEGGTNIQKIIKTQ